MKWLRKENKELEELGIGYIQESEDGKWELFISTTIFGNRVVVREKGAAWYEKEICAGGIPEAVKLLYNYVEWQLSKDEDVVKLISEIPIPERKPYYTDLAYLVDFFTLFGNKPIPTGFGSDITQEGLNNMREKISTKLFGINE